MATKRAAKNLPAADTSIRFVDCGQPGMVISDSQYGVSLDEFRGAYVKVAPTIRSSERSGVDGKAIRESLLAAGALAVVVVPVVVPDSVDDLLDPHRKAEPLKTPEQYLREWFAAVQGAGLERIEAALEQALASISEAGL